MVYRSLVASFLENEFISSICYFRAIIQVFVVYHSNPSSLYRMDDGLCAAHFFLNQAVETAALEFWYLFCLPPSFGAWSLSQDEIFDRSFGDKNDVE